LKIGLSLQQAGQGSKAKENLEYAAKQAEENRINSISVFERLLWPINPQASYPVTSDGRLPIEYQEVMDPLTTLSFLAANTKNIRLRTSVIDMLFHNPIILSEICDVRCLIRKKIDSWVRYRMVKRRIHGFQYTIYR